MIHTQESGLSQIISADNAAELEVWAESAMHLIGRGGWRMLNCKLYSSDSAYHSVLTGQVSLIETEICSLQKASLSGLLRITCRLSFHVSL